MIKVVMAAAVAMALAGCASGRIDSRWPYPVESAAPVSKAGGAPLRQMQVGLADLIESRLINDGKRIVHEPMRPLDTRSVYIGRSQYTRTGYETPGNTQLAAASSRDMNVRLDQLIAAVRDANDPKAVRNDVAAAWMAASTANCTVYVQALRSGQVSSRLLSDLFGGGLAGAASLTTPMRSARLLSTLSAFSIAEGASIDRNIFAQQGAELVADAILQLRQQTRSRIESKMKSQSYDDWPMGLAMADLFEFQNDCSMLRGFAQMRDALLVREQLVAATREAAAGVARNGGSPEQMMAVLAAMQVGHGEPAAPDPLAAWNKDLLKQKAAALKCLEASDVAVSSKADTQDLAAVKAEIDKTYAAAGACPADTEVWAKRMNIQAKKAFDDQFSLLQAADKPRQDLIAAGKSVPKDVEDKRAADIAALLKQAKANFDQSTKIMVDNNAAARNAVMAQLANMKGGTAKQVADLIRATRDTGYDGDRVLEAALVNAEAIAKSSPDEGALAATQAIGAAKGAQGA